jgi:hypothetical protein
VELPSQAFSAAHDQSAAVNPHYSGFRSAWRRAIDVGLDFASGRGLIRVGCRLLTLAGSGDRKADSPGGHRLQELASDHT